MTKPVQIKSDLQINENSQNPCEMKVGDESQARVHSDDTWQQNSIEKIPSTDFYRDNLA